MAFLCPVRIKRSKKKKPLHDDQLGPSVPSMGRITGSASIETLVRVGIEKENGLGPEAKMVVLHDFTPCVDDELEVKRGQVVHVLYQENDWVYVISEENKEGFIPHSYCAQYGSQMATLALNVRKKLPRTTTGDPSQQAGGGGGSGGGPGKATSMNGLPTTAAMATYGFQQQQAGGSTLAARLPANSTGSTSDNNTTAANTTAANTTVTSQQSVGSNNKFGLLDGAARPFGQQQQPPRAPSSNPAPSASPPGGADPASGTRSNSLMSESSSLPSGDVHPFFKESAGRYVVLYSYAAQDENDLTVDRGQCVTVLNSDDPDWYWVTRYDGSEGFVPSGFIYPLDAIQRQQNLNNNHIQHPPPQQQQLLQQQQPMFQQQHQPQMQQQQQAQPQHPLPRNAHQRVNNSGLGAPSFTSTPSSYNPAAVVNNNHGMHQQQALPYQQHQQHQQHSAHVNRNSSYHPQQPNSVQNTAAVAANPAAAAPPLGSAGGSSGPSSYSTNGGGGGGPTSYSANVNGLPTVAPMPQGSGSNSGSGFSPQQHQPAMQPATAMPANGEVTGRYHGTELVMLYDYKAQAPDDLSVRRGDWVYADLSNQTVDGWLWSFAPKTRKYGFIPRAYARPPAMTSL